MKQVVFKQGSIRNFLSFGEDTFHFQFSSGITLITGENRDKGGKNGVGKSGVPEFIAWVVFGNTLRDIKKDQITHDKATSPCYGEIEFEIIDNSVINRYHIKRQLDPNSVTFIKNGEDITRSSMPKTDELIQTTIGANIEVFRNAIIMSSTNTLPFMAQGKTAKRKFVEGVLKLGIFSNMLLKVRLDYNDEKRENDITSTQFLEKNKNLDVYQAQLEKNTAQKQLKIKEIRDKIAENQKTIDELTKTGDINLKKIALAQEIATIEGKLAKLEERNQQESVTYQEILKNEHVLSAEIQRLKKERKDASEKTGTCPTCKRSYSDEEEKKHLQQHLVELDAKIKQSKEEHDKVEAKRKKQEGINFLIQQGLTKLRNTAKQSFEEQSSLALSTEKVNQLQESNRSMQQSIDSLETEKDSMETLIQNTQKEREATEKTLKEIQKKLVILETAKFVVSEEGVKSYIIKKLLGLLNSRLNFYLQALEAPCKCEFNETFEETLTSDNGQQKSYFNYSSGEQKRIDLAILFMFQDILRIQSNCSYNISIYDELLDSALDEKGSIKVLDILRSRVEQYNEAVYIISHNKTTSSNIDQTIVLEKINGCTNIASQ